MRTSLIIPAYNEERRLPAFLEALVDFHTEHPDTLTEVILVDDGSRDRTVDIANTFLGRLPLKLVSLGANSGKGAAVRAGVLAAQGDLAAFMDADGATQPSELPKLLEALKDEPIAVGNRWMPGSHVEGREPFRALSGWVYRMYMDLFGLRGIDTMCGFKGFQRDIARTLFARLHDERWLFDAEVMLRARQLGHTVANVPIAWTSQRGSKLRPATLLRAFFQLPVLAVRVWTEKTKWSPTGKPVAPE